MKKENKRKYRQINTNLVGDEEETCEAEKALFSREEDEDWAEEGAVKAGGEDWVIPTFSLKSLSNVTHFIVLPSLDPLNIHPILNIHQIQQISLPPSEKGKRKTPFKHKKKTQKKIEIAAAKKCFVSKMAEMMRIRKIDLQSTISKSSRRFFFFVLF